MNLGWTEILLIVGVGLILFGPSRLPQLGKSMGQAIRGFKKGLSDEMDGHAEKEVNPQLAHKPEDEIKTKVAEKEDQKNS
ncbi:MAG: twin-arginine translocase TatA/TatE family subunit [Bdellovibrionia bacterium]